MSSTNLAPGLLLATPKLTDGIFRKSVVLLASHGADGAFGWILNGRSLGALKALLRDSGLSPAGVTLPDTPPYEHVVQVGGPVSPRSAWLLFQDERQWKLDNVIDLVGSWKATGERSPIEAVARGEGPADFRLLLGFSRWAPGQLEREISTGVWLPVDLDEQVAFSSQKVGEGFWLEAYDKCLGMSPYAFVSGGVGTS